MKEWTPKGTLAQKLNVLISCCDGLLLLLESRRVSEEEWKRAYTTFYIVTQAEWHKSLSLDEIQGSLNKFPDFFCMGTFIDSTHIWNSSPLTSNLLQLQCTCTVPTTSARPHGSPLVWACQWPFSQPLSSPQLSHNDSLWA